MKTVGVILENDEKTYYLEVGDIELRMNSTVVAETDKGTFFATVVSFPEEPQDTIGQVLRTTTKKDYQNYKNNQEKAKEALDKCQEIAAKYDMDIKVMDATFSLNREQLLFHFFAEERVDFRSLAKDLASIYKTRIELRQIGVRDRAKKVSGCGICGQKLCCSRFLDDFDSISISMAKNQNISLNPNKINGVCGRLLCCLKYENECYQECKKRLPKIGSQVNVGNEQGKVVSVNILKGTYTVELPNQSLVEVNKEDGSN